MQKCRVTALAVFYLGTAMNTLAANAERQEQPVIVTATRSAQTADAALASVTVISRQDIERQQARSIQDLFRGVPGINVVNQGGPGKATFMQMRGTESDHVLVMIDNIKVGSATSGTTAFENIPIISYIVLRGHCSQCHANISLRYPAVEATTALLSGFVAWHFGFSIIAVAALFFVWALIALAVIDINTQLLPDDITLPLLWLGLIVNMDNGFTTILSAVMGAILGYLSLWSIYWSFKIITGKEGMGYGDFKLLSAIGAWLGWNMLPLVILFSSLAGAIIGIGLIIATKFRKNLPMPFGPYLVVGALIALFWGEYLNLAYLGLF